MNLLHTNSCNCSATPGPSPEATVAPVYTHLMQLQSRAPRAVLHQAASTLLPIIYFNPNPRPCPALISEVQAMENSAALLFPDT